MPLALAGDDPNVAIIPAQVVVTADTPEPSACVLALCGAGMLAGFRRRQG